MASGYALQDTSSCSSLQIIRTGYVHLCTSWHYSCGLSWKVKVTTMVRVSM